jgi:hypothetical protein
LQHVGNRNCCDNQDERDDGNSDIPENQARQGHAVTGLSAPAAADFSAGDVPHDDCGDRGGQEKEQDSADEAADRQAARFGGD